MTMHTDTRPHRRARWTTLGGLALILGASLLMSAQDVQRIGLPDDWTHHHLIFSNPGSFVDAAIHGRYEQWARVMSDPRYTMQQIKRGAIPASPFAPRPDPSNPRMPPRIFAASGDNSIKQDWSVSMGAGASGASAVYPAKYTLAPASSESCSDYVVFPTTVTGSTTVPNVIAYTDLYATTCSPATVPTQYWAASFKVSSTYGTVTTSPVISLDGTEVAFIESIGSHAYLVVALMPTANSSSITAVTCPSTTNVNNVSRTTSPQAWCAEFGDADDDAISSPFYDYAGNVLYVGDASGVLHKFQNVFHSYYGGTTTTLPSENTTSPWPVTVSSGYVLASPVYDSTSGLVFLGDSEGYLESVSASAGTLVKTTTRFSHGGGIMDAPIVDSSTKEVYFFSGWDEIVSGCTSSARCNVVWQVPTSFTAGITGAGGANGNGAHVGAASVDDTAALLSGAFDNTYFTGSGSTGYLYVVGDYGGDETLYQISMSAATFGATVTTVATLGSAALTTTTGSNVTEVYNGSTDWIFFTTTVSGTLVTSPTCTGACVYSYKVTGGTPAVGSGIAATGGAGGIIIDNTSSATGASQIYYATIGATDAVQAAQSGL